jgi:type I restriction enzyme S subunit
MFGDPVTNPKGWQLASLQSLLSEKSINGAYYPKKFYTENGISMVHMADAFYGVVDPSGVKQVKAPDKDVNKYGLLPSDLLISRRSLNYEGSAKPCRIPEINKPLIFESSLIRIRPDPKKILTIYLFYYLQNKRARSKYVFPLVTRSTISGISQSNLMKVSVLVPPREIQCRFASIVETIEQQVSRLQTHLSELDNLFASLQSSAFKGEL